MIGTRSFLSFIGLDVIWSYFIGEIENKIQDPLNIVKKNEVYEKACESLPSSYI